MGILGIIFDMTVIIGVSGFLITPDFISMKLPSIRCQKMLSNIYTHPPKGLITSQQEDNTMHKLAHIVVLLKNNTREEAICTSFGFGDPYFSFTDKDGRK